MAKNFETKENLWWRGREIVAAAPQVYIDVDVEADGIAGFGSMLSVGAESVTGASYYSEIRPASSEYIPSNRNFCEQHGLERDRLMDEARPFTEVMSEFYEWTDNERRQCGKRAVFAAFNAGFDWAHTDLYFARAGLVNPYGIAPFDIKSLLVSLHGDWDWTKTNKSYLPPEITPD
ncbi:MAG TPA: hypothetical protein VFT59_00085, partial [Candidatus Saccharimonadales bacterium]|nr:hypothetical protein [Candidatus Saccharimonadales bacterium]